MEKILLLCFVFFAALVNAQSEEKVTTVFMINGEVYKGNMIAYINGEYLVLKRLNGNIDTIPDSKINRIEQIKINTINNSRNNRSEKYKPRYDKPKPKLSIKRKYKFKDKGWYNITGFTGYGGKSGNFIKLGIGISSVTGYLFNLKLGLGVGIGKDNFSTRQGEGLYPVFVEARGYLQKKRNTPFYSLKVGYSFAFESEKYSITKAEGGILFNPSIGYRFGGDKTGNIYFDIGYKRQKQFIERTSTFNSDVTIVEALYNRISFGAGIIF